MKIRYYLKNAQLGIQCEAEYSAKGMQKLKELRKNDKRFARRVIKELIQVYPEQIPLTDGISAIYELGYRSVEDNPNTISDKPHPTVKHNVTEQWPTNVPTDQEITRSIETR